MITKLKYHLDKLYDHYDNNGESSSRVHNGSDSSTTIDESESSENSFHFMSKSQKYRAFKSDVESKSELDRYLMEDIEYFELVEGKFNQILSTCPNSTRCFSNSHYNGCFRVDF
jgi:hypothetical protein